MPPMEMLRAEIQQQQEAEKKPMVMYAPPAIQGISSSEAMRLAQHLKKIDAKMYGAYWCSHCFNQKQMFGAGANRLVQYVECAEDGYQSQRQLCRAKQVNGYPTWEIEGKLYGGERSLSSLAEISGLSPPFQIDPRGSLADDNR